MWETSNVCIHVTPAHRELGCKPWFLQSEQTTISPQLLYFIAMPSGMHHCKDIMQKRGIMQGKGGLYVSCIYRRWHTLISFLCCCLLAVARMYRHTVSLVRLGSGFWESKSLSLEKKKEKKFVCLCRGVGFWGDLSAFWWRRQSLD